MVHNLQPVTIKNIVTKKSSLAASVSSPSTSMTVRRHPPTGSPRRLLDEERQTGTAMTLTRTTSELRSIQQFLDSEPMGRRRWTIILLAFTIIALDGMDVSVWSFVYPSMVTEWGTPISAITAIVTVGVVGMAIGALVGGPLSDRVGRRTVILVGTAWFTVFTLLGATSGDATFIGIYRFLACIALGAVMPTAVTVVAEFMPSARRATLITIAFAGFTFGTIVQGYLSALIIPTLGWRALLVITGLISLVVLPLIAWKIPESVSFLALKGRSPQRIRSVLQAISPKSDVDAVSTVAETDSSSPGEKSGKGGVRLLLSRKFLIPSLLLWLCYFAGLSVVYLLTNYLPLIIKNAGMSAADAGIIVAMVGWGGTVGSLLVGAAMGKLGRYRVLAVGFGLGALSIWAVAAFSLGFSGLAVLAFAWGLFIPGMNTGVNAVAALLYPTSARGSGVSWMHGFGRFGTIVSGIFGGVMIAWGWTTGQIFFAIGFPLLFGTLAMAALGAITKKRNNAPVQVDVLVGKS